MVATLFKTPSRRENGSAVSCKRYCPLTIVTSLHRLMYLYSRLTFLVSRPEPVLFQTLPVRTEFQKAEILLAV